MEDGNNYLNFGEHHIDLIMNFEEFDSKLKFLGRIFENKLKNGWNSDNLEATTQSYWVQMEI